jgi:hypothetical protein
MADAVILLLLALTSGLALLIGAGPLRLPLAALARGFGQFLECVGLGCGFLVLNLAVGMLGVLGLRALSLGFISLYYVNDLAFVAVSLLQGALFFCWRAASRANGEKGCTCR